MCNACQILRVYVRHVQVVHGLPAIWDALGTQKSPPPTWGEGLHLLFADYFHRHLAVMAQRTFEHMEALATEGAALVGQLAQPREAHGAPLVPVRGVGQAPVYSHASASGSRVPITRP